jgi:hypothetical protein
MALSMGPTEIGEVGECHLSFVHGYLQGSPPPSEPDLHIASWAPSHDRKPQEEENEPQMLLVDLKEEATVTVLFLESGTNQN